MDSIRQGQKEELEQEKTTDLFALLREKQDITIRDDHFDFVSILDAVRRFQDHRCRFRLIDTGVFDAFELEWITNQGADLYTSDEIRTDLHELELINASSAKGNAIVALLVNGHLEAGEEDGSLSFFDLMNVGRAGVYIHLTNRKKTHDPARIAHLAYDCKKGGSWLVYYHHGPLSEPLIEVGSNGAWIHISDQSLEEENSHSLFRDIILSARSSGSNVILHWEKGVRLSLFEDAVKFGAVVLFKSALLDYKSPIKVLEKGMRKQRLDFKSYYLYPTVLP
jgi:hypothetical protein